MAFSTALQNYSAKFLLGEHKTSRQRLLANAKFMMRLYVEMEKRMEVSPLPNFAADWIVSSDFIETSRGDCESQG